MSFFEDNVEDGSHCASCCQFIGVGGGHPQTCRACQTMDKPNVPKERKPHKKTKLGIQSGRGKEWE